MAPVLLDLRKTTETRAGITAMSQERNISWNHSRLAEEETEKVRYQDILQNDSREIVSISGCKTLNDMTSRARERDIDLENIVKREPDQLLIVKGLGRRP